jgi:hypothetical protein
VTSPVSNSVVADLENGLTHSLSFPIREDKDVEASSSFGGNGGVSGI